MCVCICIVILTLYIFVPPKELGIELNISVVFFKN